MVPLLCSYDTAIKWISQGENGGDAGWWMVGKWRRLLALRIIFCFFGSDRRRNHHNAMDSTWFMFGKFDTNRKNPADTAPPQK